MWWDTKAAKKKGPGRGWWGPPRGTHGADPKKMTRAQLEKRGYVAVYRGTGPRGLEKVRPSSEGVLGPGVYFYDSPVHAATYAEMGGGVITGFVHKDDVRIKKVPGSQFSSAHGVVVLDDPAKFIRRGTVPTTETSRGWSKEDIARFDERFDGALDEIKALDEFTAALARLRKVARREL
jgi:hypothetical protein